MVKKFFFGVAIVFLISAILACYVYFDNQRVKTAEYTYSSEMIPDNFDGFKICVVTDFHSGKNGKKVVNAVKQAEADIICIVGDLVNMNDTDFTNARTLVKELSAIGDVYFSYGNHEIWSNSENKTEIPVIKEELKDLPVTFMNDEVRTIEKEGQKINLIGYGDDVYDDFDGLFRKQGEKRLTALYNTLDPSVVSILMMHRSQYFDMASDIGYDIVLGGHLHGGHIGIKKIQSRILKKHFGSDVYSKGEYKSGNSTMYVCGGLANKNDIPRIFNTPEIMVVELDAK